jgi:hypothetical protein
MVTQNVGKIMRRTIVLPAILLLALFVSGCNDVHTVSRAELEKAKSAWQEPKLSTWYYVGTKGQYHYFSHVDLPETKIYRIRQTEMFRIGKEDFPLTKNQKHWQQMPWGIHGPERTKGT